MNRLIDALIRFLEAVGRTPGEEFSHGLGTYRLIEHPREERVSLARTALGEEDEVLRLAS